MTVIFPSWAILIDGKPVAWFPNPEFAWKWATFYRKKGYEVKFMPDRESENAADH